jgi:hypothetical protein
MSRFKLESLILLLLVLILFLVLSPQNNIDIRYNYFIGSKKLTPYDRKERIVLNLNILDIYRIDTSCDYMPSIGFAIPDTYKNQIRKCSLSSLRPNLENLLSASKVENKSWQIYEPALFNEFHYEPFSNEDKISKMLFEGVKKGGFYAPNLIKNKECALRDLENIVFIVPYTKNRESNLALFLINIHRYLKSANSFKYQILIVEQINLNGNFNKGRLYNSAFRYIMERQKITNTIVDCIVLHDIDLIPSNYSKYLEERGDYRCRQMPWHMTRKIWSLSLDKDVIYGRFLTGGVLSLRPQHFIDANGMSNEYFNWGAEDVRNLVSKIGNFQANQSYLFMKLG